LFTGGARPVVDAILKNYDASCGCVSSVNTASALYLYLGLGFGPARVDKKNGMCDVNCNNDFLMHLVKGVFIDPELILLFKILAGLQRYFDNGGKKDSDDVKAILDEFKTLFAKNKVLSVPDRISKYLLSYSADFEGWGLQFIE
jgi:hypothetical protein